MVRADAAKAARVGGGRRLIDGENGNGDVAADDRVRAGAAELAHRLVHSAGAGAERQHGVAGQGEIANANASGGAEGQSADVDIRAARERAGRVQREHADAVLGQGTGAGAERISEGDVVAVGV